MIDKDKKLSPDTCNLIVAHKCHISKFYTPLLSTIGPLSASGRNISPLSTAHRQDFSQVNHSGSSKDSEKSN